MCKIFRDISMRFSSTEAGIWLGTKDKRWFLPLRDCLNPINAQQESISRKCVGSRDITKLTFTFSSTPPVQIVFEKGLLAYIRTGKTAAQRFHILQKELQSLGYCTYDLS